MAPPPMDLVTAECSGSMRRTYIELAPSNFSVRRTPLMISLFSRASGQHIDI